MVGLSNARPALLQLKIKDRESIAARLNTLDGAFHFNVCPCTAVFLEMFTLMHWRRAPFLKAQILTMIASLPRCHPEEDVAHGCNPSPVAQCGVVQDVDDIFFSCPLYASEEELLREAARGACLPSESLYDFFFPTGPPG